MWANLFDSWIFHKPIFIQRNKNACWKSITSTLTVWESNNQLKWCVLHKIMQRWHLEVCHGWWYDSDKKIWIIRVECKRDLTTMLNQSACKLLCGNMAIITLKSNSKSIQYLLWFIIKPSWWYLSFTQTFNRLSSQ